MRALRTSLTVLAAAAALRAGEARAQQQKQPTAADPERWQIERADGSYLWDLRLARVAGRRGDTLVVASGDALVRVPVDSIDELRQVKKSAKVVGAGARGVLGGLLGADDEVYRLSLLTPEERRRTVARLVAEHAATQAPSRKKTRAGR
jgi:hypothetical protein